MKPSEAKMLTSAESKNRRNYWVPMVGHAFRALEALFQAEGALSLQQITECARVNRTSAFRILFTLGNLGYVERDAETGKYRPTSKITSAARRIAGRDIVGIARPYLRQLHARFNETVNLATLRNTEIVYVEILESEQPFRMAEEIGSRVPINSTALGKCIAAFMQPQTLRSVMKRSRLKKFTDRTIANRRRFMALLAQVRKRGIAFDDEETERGGSCIGAPILNSRQEAVAAISVSGPTQRMRALRPEIIRHLKQSSEIISGTLETFGQ